MYQDKVNSLTADGVWNVAMSDLIPLAMANVLQKKQLFKQAELSIVPNWAKYQ